MSWPHTRQDSGGRREEDRKERSAKFEGSVRVAPGASLSRMKRMVPSIQMCTILMASKGKQGVTLLAVAGGLLCRSSAQTPSCNRSFVCLLQTPSCRIPFISVFCTESFRAHGQISPSQSPDEDWRLIAAGNREPYSAWIAAAEVQQTFFVPLSSLPFETTSTCGNFTSIVQVR